MHLDLDWKKNTNSGLQEKIRRHQAENNIHDTEM